MRVSRLWGMVALPSRRMPSVLTAGVFPSGTGAINLSLFLSMLPRG